ncbi:MAG: hypothetical protein M1813_007079 [Trichoglossum hirsutum]|nr:MAG: hypothetical protein M1813_007079 [Trichoglossum hirsutum]
MLAISKIYDFGRYLVEDELSYNLSRKYPFGKLFKALVFAGAILILIPLTVFNIATNGYDNQPKYTTDPNTTESERKWYNKPIFTWGDDRLNPKCQHIGISVGHEFMTTNLGLRYTVRRILHFAPGSPIAQQQSTVSYHNNTLTNCEVNEVNIRLKKADLSKPQKNNLWWSWMDSSADAVARCDITNDEGFFTLEFLVEYATLFSDYSYVAVDDAINYASFWWGARLLNAYFLATQYVMSGQLPDSNDNTPIYTHATLSYRAGSNTSMKDPKLFSNWYYFLESNGNINNIPPDVSEIYNNASFSLSRPLTEGLFFAKVFRSFILVDLGNSQAPNLLLDPNLLQYALDPGADDFNRGSGAPLIYDPKKPDWQFAAFSPPNKKLERETAVLMDEAFAKFKDQTGPLKTKPAYIYMEYICSVPEKKATSAVVLFTLVADFALFQTAWMLFKYVADRTATWKKPSGNYCEGCLDYRRRLIPMDDEDGDSINLQKAKNFHSRSSSTQSLVQDGNLDGGNGHG